MLHFLIEKLNYSLFFCFLTSHILGARLGLGRLIAGREGNNSSVGSFTSKINSSIQEPISRKRESNPNFEELQVAVSCGKFTQEQCLSQPGCFICLYECRPRTLIQSCPENIDYLPISSDKVVNNLILSNGTLEFYFGIQFTNPVTAVNVWLDVPFKNYINITASYNSVSKKVTCNLTPQNNSIVFPFYKTFHVFIKVYFGTIYPLHFIISDQVRFVDPIIKEIGPNSALINHPSIFTFKFTRIATRHIQTVKLVYGDSTIGCKIELKKTVNFNCQFIVVGSTVNWQYLSIHVANINWYSYAFQLKPYPTINQTSLSQSFPGYSIPFHFIGTNFYSFSNLEVYISYFSGDKMLLNCTVVSDTDLYCSNDKFPSDLPAIGTFVWYSHSNQLFNLPDLKFKASPPPDLVLFKQTSNQLKFGISNYHPDYLSNTSIRFVCDCEANINFGCTQIQFKSTENLITCNYNNISLTGTHAWMAILSIGSHEFTMLLVAKAKKSKIYYVLPLIPLGLIGSLGLGAYCFWIQKAHKLKSEILWPEPGKSATSIQNLATKAASTHRLNSYTKFPVMSRSDTKVTSKSLIIPSQTIY